jgi:hypothetical protein
MIRKWAQDFRDLVAWWWTCDQIRVSPDEGRLLQIQPGDLLTLDGVDAEVLDRHVTAEGFLCLTCRTDVGSAELHVEVSPGQESLELVWHSCGSRHLLAADDVQVWPRGSQQRIQESDPSWEEIVMRIIIGALGTVHGLFVFWSLVAVFREVDGLSLGIGLVVILADLCSAISAICGPSVRWMAWTAVFHNIASVILPLLDPLLRTGNDGGESAEGLGLAIASGAIVLILGPLVVNAVLLICLQAFVLLNRPR